MFLTLEQEFPQDDRRNAKGQFFRDLQADAVRGLATELKTPRIPFGLAAGKSPQAIAWGVGENDLVVVLYDRMKVAKAWTSGRPGADRRADQGDRRRRGQAGERGVDIDHARERYRSGPDLQK